MKKVLLAGLLACIGGSASAFIPPTYRVALVGQEREDVALGHALVEYMVAEQAFFRFRDGRFESAAKRCVKIDDVPACLRKEIAELGPEPRVRSVAVIVTPAGEGQQRWQCIGSGERVAPAKDTNTMVNIEAALFGTPDEQNRNLGAAVSCIQGAANESSPR